MLLEKIAAQARTQPHKTAFIHNGTACSYAEFALRLQQAVQWLRANGVSGQGVALVCVDHLVQAWTIGIALRHLGLTTWSVASVDEAAALVRDTTRCLVTWAPEIAPRTAAQAAVLGCRWVNVPPALDPSHAVEFDLPDAPPALIAGHIIPTSGTTGTSKLILRDAASEASTLDLHARINGIGTGSVVYVRDFPLWTAGGYRWPLLTWHQGATVVFQQWQDFHIPFHDPALVRTLTHAFATPMTLMFVVNAPELPVRRNDAMRLLVTGGVMPRTLVKALQARLTHQVVTVLASTEALTVSATPVDHLDDIAWHRIHPEREAQVVDDTHQPLPTGQVGLLRVKILDGVAGYLGDAAASRMFFRDGYFYSGDLAVVRSDGRLALCGRVTDVINVLGSKLATAPIEAALQTQLGADAVCLMSLPRPGADDEVVVAVECQHEPTREALQRAAKDLLNVFGRVHFQFFRQLPRNRMGKVVRPALRAHILDRLPKTA